MTPVVTIPFVAGTDEVCYLILPDGFNKDLEEGLRGLSERHGVTMVVVGKVDWNDDLTPWPAAGVFKKAKPFGGGAAEFLDTLSHHVIPVVETQLGIKNAHRTLLGISLSGLFALWTAFQSEVFSNIISISGSLWYDGFTEWMKTQRLSSSVEKVCLLLGDREKHSKEKRMASVEDHTQVAADILKAQCRCTFELVEGTHFSPVMPRMGRAFQLIFEGC